MKILSVGAVANSRPFGFTFTVVFFTLAAVAFWRNWPGPMLYLGLSLGTLVVTLTVPNLLAPLCRMWMKFGDLLHSIVNPLILGIIFFGLMTPTGLVMRTLGRDPMKRYFDVDAASYWEDRSDFQDAANGFKRQF